MTLLFQNSKEDLQNQLAKAAKELEEVKKIKFDTDKEKEEKIAESIGRKLVIELRLKKLG